MLHWPLLHTVMWSSAQWHTLAAGWLTMGSPTAAVLPPCHQEAQLLPHAHTQAMHSTQPVHLLTRNCPSLAGEHGLSTQAPAVHLVGQLRRALWCACCPPHALLTLSTMALARYSTLAELRPAREMRPSRVM